MNKIIDGHKYDTETAPLMAEIYPEGYNARDFNYYHEALYRTKRGQYFLYGEGGANSPYARSCGTNWWGSGERIELMSESEAREWAEANCSGDEYEKIFGPVENDEFEQVSVILASSDVDALRKFVENSGMSLAEVLTEWIREKAL